MKIERLKENNKKKWIIGIIVFILLVSTINLVVSRAKYKVTQKVRIVEGTINYSKSDLNIVALYDVNGNSIDKIPEGTWEINQTKSFCATDGSSNIANKDKSLTISIINNKISVSNITKKNTKCFIYLQIGKTVDEVIKSLELIEDEPDFTVPTPPTSNYIATSQVPAPRISQSGVYSTSDEDGTTYYYRGAVENNYLKFGKNSSGQDMWWRIIRFNGDGSIRIIYDGTEYHANGTVTDNSIAIKKVQFNTSNDITEYVGYMYTIGEEYGHDVSSNIKKELDKWYESNLNSYENYIDQNAGFCGDRSLYRGEGTGSASFNNFNPDPVYSAEYRLLPYYFHNYNKNKGSVDPSFGCPEWDDLYTTNSSNKGNKALTYPIGLITADEVMFAGNAYNSTKTNYLYNGQWYWTMTPMHGASVYSMRGVENVANCGYAGCSLLDVRPVINLSSRVHLSGNGTQSSPYEVVGLS